MSSQSNPPRILIAGAAYGGLNAALNVLNITDGKPHLAGGLPLKPIRVPDVPPHVTIIDERDGIFHSMGTPLVHVKDGSIEQSWVRYRDIPALKRPNVDILQGKLLEIDPLQRKAFWRGTNSSEDEPDRILEYDYFIAATGLTRAWPILPSATTRRQYIEEARGHIANIASAGENPVVVIGGGAVGTEFAAEVKHYHPERRVVLVHSRGTLMSNEPLPDEFKAKTLDALHDQGIEVKLSTRVLSETPSNDGKTKTLELANGEVLTAGHTIWTTARHIPQTDFLPSECLNEEGAVKVQSTMQFCPTIPNSTVHFAAGDIADWSGIKRVGRAFSTGQCAAVNVMTLLANSNNKNIDTKPEAADQEEFATELIEFPHVPPMISLAVGNTAVMYFPEGGVSGGPDLYKQSFGEDLGLKICWTHLGLPYSPPVAA